MGVIRLHWSASKNNFGDVLSPLIVERVSGKKVVHAPIEDADIVAVGSLLQRLGERFWHRRLNIWGAGFIGPTKAHTTRHFIHAVRGPETASALCLDEAGLLMGDPGLLVNLLQDRLSVRKGKYRLTVIPHYQDKESPQFRHFMALNPDAHVLDVLSDPVNVLSDIASSRLVVSSAMHGLIASDGLGVPNIRIRFSDGLRGGNFKFRDYYGVYGMAPPEIPVVAMTEAMCDEIAASYQRPGVADIQEKLISGFPSHLT